MYVANKSFIHSFIHSIMMHCGLAILPDEQYVCLRKDVLRHHKHLLLCLERSISDMMFHGHEERNSVFCPKKALQRNYTVSKNLKRNKKNF